MNITEANAVTRLLDWLGADDRDAVDDAKAAAAAATLAERAGKALNLSVPGADELIDLVADRLRAGPGVVDVLLEVGWWDEIDGDGTEASVLADHVRALATRRGVVTACRVCGCTDDRACDGGCSWAEADLCSRCAPAAASDRAAQALGAALARHVAHGGSIPWPAVRRPFEAWQAAHAKAGAPEPTDG